MAPSDVNFLGLPTIVEFLDVRASGGRLFPASLWSQNSCIIGPISVNVAPPELYKILCK